MHHGNGSTYFTDDENIIASGIILSGPAALGSDQKAVGPFSNLFITDRALIWDKIVIIFQGSDEWTYLKPAEKHCDLIMGYNLIYNHYLGSSNIDQMASGAEKKLVQSTYIREKRICTFEKNDILHKEKHNILESLKEHGYTGINQQSNFRYLFKGIKNMFLNSVKTRIMSDKSLRQYFDGIMK